MNFLKKHITIRHQYIVSFITLQKKGNIMNTQTKTTKTQPALGDKSIIRVCAKTQPKLGDKALSRTC